MNYPTDTQREMDAAELRRQQAEEGRRMAEAEKTVQRPTLKLAPRGQVPTRAARDAAPTVKAKGHEAFLKALQLSHADVVIEKMNGDVYYGKIKHSDKFTVTINVVRIQRQNVPGVEITEAYDRVIFKHDISEFYTTTPPVHVRAGAAA
jgi:sRNA-binding regulator protein Hfq